MSLLRDNNGKYIRLNNGEMFFNYEMNSDLETPNISSNIANILKVGDLLRIEYYSSRYDERVTELFLVSDILYDKSIIYLESSHINLHTKDGEFIEKEYEPVILSIITKEKLESAEYSLSNIQDFKRSR